MHHFQTNLPAFVAAVQEKCRNLNLSCQLAVGKQRPGIEGSLAIGNADSAGLCPLPRGCQSVPPTSPPHSSSFLQADCSKSLQIPVKPRELGLYTTLGRLVPLNHHSDAIFGIAALQIQQCLGASLLYAPTKDKEDQPWMKVWAPGFGQESTQHLNVREEKPLSHV